jgi:hypothetical protein
MGEVDPIGFIEGAIGLDEAERRGDSRPQRCAVVEYRNSRCASLIEGQRRCCSNACCRCRDTWALSGPAHARGKWCTIGIHCHVRCDKAAAMVVNNATVSHWFLETAANEQSRSINRQNGECTRLQGSSPEKRIEDMDRMGIDFPAILPAPRQTYYGADPDLGRDRHRARPHCSWELEPGNRCAAPARRPRRICRYGATRGGR